MLIYDGDIYNCETGRIYSEPNDILRSYSLLSSVSYMSFSLIYDNYTKKIFNFLILIH